MPRIEGTDLDVSTLCLGGNVFGWTAKGQDALDVLDGYVAGGGNFIDTSDSYSAWVPGNSGGESETILGEWTTKRNNRADVIIATKVSQAPSRPGLSAANIAAALDDSLARLNTDYIDLYYAHRDDPNTPLEETLQAFETAVSSGKVRYIAASNFTAPRLAESLAIQKKEGIARYVALQPPYNLVNRDYEKELAPLLLKEGVSCLPYSGLASGFLTGKYRGNAKVDSVRAEGASKYGDKRGLLVLDALDAIAASHKTNVSAVALAWLAAKPTVTSPIASARTVDQLKEILEVNSLTLDAAEVAALDEASS